MLSNTAYKHIQFGENAKVHKVHSFFFFFFLQEFKEFCPDEQFVKGTFCLDICSWDPSYSKTQVNLMRQSPLQQLTHTDHDICLNAIVFFFPPLRCLFRNIDQSHFVALSARFLPNTTQATRITSAMFTEVSLRAKFCSTVRTAHSSQARGLWRRTSKYSTSPAQPGRIMGTCQEPPWQRTKCTLIGTDREMLWRNQCTFAKSARSGILSTML